MLVPNSSNELNLSGSSGPASSLRIMGDDGECLLVELPVRGHNPFSNVSLCKERCPCGDSLEPQCSTIFSGLNPLMYSGC